MERSAYKEHTPICQHSFRVQCSGVGKGAIATQLPVEGLYKSVVWVAASCESNPPAIRILSFGSKVAVAA